MNRKALGVGVVLLALFGLAVWGVLRNRTPEGVYLFEGLEGPSTRSVVVAETPTGWRRYAGGEPSRMAVLLTDTTSAWIGLAHSLTTIGVPFSLTTDPAAALRHRVVLVYPTVSGSVLRMEALRGLAAHVREGGTVIGFGVFGGLQDLFGFTAAVESRGRKRMDWLPEGARRFGFRLPEEVAVPLGAEGTAGAAEVGSLGYDGVTATVLARFDDATAAVTHRKVGAGDAYAFGVDLATLTHLAYSARAERVSPAFANAYVPVLDVFLRALRTLYQEHEPLAVTLHTVPEGQDLTVLLTHDVDYSRSWEPSLVYARSEQESGVEATYFIQTKYLRDWNDRIFFTDTTRAYLDSLKRRGMEVGSHTVSHSNVYNQYALGDGREAYPAYRPFVLDSMSARGGSVLDELRVSKFLLEQTSGLDVVSFRPGHLSYPFALPQALAATGFRYSSSSTANTALTHLPFRVTWGRQSRMELPVWEFPVTIEDELDLPMTGRLPQALRMAEALRAYGGLMVVLIHPNLVDEKLTFQERFVSATRSYAWYGTMGAFGAWWAARDAVQVDVQTSGTRHEVQVQAPESVAGLTLRVPASWRPTEPLERTGQGWRLPALRGTRRFTFETR